MTRDGFSPISSLWLAPRSLIKRAFASGALAAVVLQGCGSRGGSLSQKKTTSHRVSEEKANAIKKALKALKITSPAKDARVNERVVKTKGKCHGDAEIAVSGDVKKKNQTILCEQNHFQTKVKLAGDDGEKKVVFTQTVAGRASSASTTVKLDTSKPKLSIEAPESGDASYAPIDVDLSCEKGSFVQVKGDLKSNVQRTCKNGTLEVEVSLAGEDGAKEIQVTLEDPAGNVATETVEVHKDNQLPEISLETGTDLTPASTEGPDTKITGSASDRETSVQVVVSLAKDGNSNACLNNKLDTFASDCPNWVPVSLENGRWSLSLADSVFVDGSTYELTGKATDKADNTRKVIFEDFSWSNPE